MPNEPVYQNPNSLETPGSQLTLTAWNVQSIVYELLANYMLVNDPQKIGFSFTQKYAVDKTKSGIHLDIGYNWKTTEAAKLPACYITRGDLRLQKLTLGEMIDMDTKTSETTRLSLNRMEIQVTCIAEPVGFTEQFAEYVKQAFMSFNQEIKAQFGFRRFQLVGMSKPAIYLESKTKSIVVLTIDIAFDEGWTVRGNDLKLKTVSRAIYDGVTEQACVGCVQVEPLLNQ